MERKKLCVILIPSACTECTKEGMEAIYCPLFPKLESELAEVVHCATIGNDKDKQLVSGGRFNHSWRSLKPEGVKKASTPRSSRTSRKPGSN